MFPPLNGLTLAYDKTYALNARAPTLIQFDCLGVSEVRFIPSSPLQFVMDNLEVTVHQIPTLSIRITGVSSNTGTALYVQGRAGRTTVVEASADLDRWTPISTNVMPFTLCPVCPSVNVIDAAGKSSAHRFYRAVELP